MDANKLTEILKSHKAWLNGKKGMRAYLIGANLRGADLSDTELSSAKLYRADLSDADLGSANLRSADLRYANLHGANLSGANLDYACCPLWDGSLDVKVDRRIAAQLAYYFCRLDCNDPDYLAARKAIMDFANTFHRADACGKIEDLEEAAHE